MSVARRMRWLYAAGLDDEAISLALKWGYTLYGWPATVARLLDWSAYAAGEGEGSQDDQPEHSGDACGGKGYSGLADAKA